MMEETLYLQTSFWISSVFMNRQPDSLEIIPYIDTREPNNLQNGGTTYHVTKRERWLDSCSPSVGAVSKYRKGIEILTEFLIN